MTVRIVRLGSERLPGEGLRIGTVRRPPLKSARAALASGTDREWRGFVRRYRAEMKRPDNRALLDTLAALSHTADFSVGCYCADEARCHRSVLRELLAERGARLAQ